FQKKPFGEPKAQSITSGVGGPVGLPGGKMTDKQKDMLMKLVASYANRLPAEVAATEMKMVKDDGVDKIHFAYTAGAKPGPGHTYRVQGTTFVIEFLNDQADSAGNVANHIHSCWRRIDGDFGIKAK